MTSLILPATEGLPTRASRKSGKPAKGLAEFDLRKFATRFGAFQASLRKAPTRKQAREAKEKAQRDRFLRPFFPQSGVKVERADTNDNDRARGRVYFTLTNGQVVRADKLARKGSSMLFDKIQNYVLAQENAA